MNISYFLNLPANSPATDFNNLMTNTNSVDTWAAIDHIPFLTNNGGYHAQVHMLNKAATLDTANGVLYTNTATTPASTSQLFFKNATSTYQLTGNLIAFNGYMWVSGVLVQWGQIVGAPGSVNNSTGVIIYPIPFPTNLFTVYTAPIVNTSVATPSINNPLSIAQDQNNVLYLSQLNWLSRTESSQYIGFNWLAIGN